MMKIVAEKTQYHRFCFFYDYNPEVVQFCQDLKDSYGWKSFSFNSMGELKRWVFSESLLVSLIKARFPETEIDPMVETIMAHERVELEKAERKQQQLNIVKGKTDTDFHIPGLKRELYPYQKIGVEFLTFSGGRAIIADAPGLGKTAQALGFIKYSNFRRVLIVAPASVKFAWKLEIEKWTNFTCEVIDSKTDPSDISASVKVWIINYDILKKHLDQLSKIYFDCMVGDECQLIKSMKAQRTKAFRIISRNIQSIVLLSGTPLLSRPAELFSLLNIIDPGTWNNFYDFARRYCAAHQGRWGFDVSGVSNPEELHARIRNYFIRRNKSEVLKELPAKNYIDFPVQLTPEIQEKYDTAATDLAEYLEQFSGKQPAEIARTMAGEKLTRKNILRALCAEGKIETASDLIESILESGEKVLVFSSFINPLNKLMEKFADQSVMITGQTPIEDREVAVTRFQNDSTVKVFFGGIRSAGVGITLTAASNVIFLDFPWNPADYQQAQDRVHRPGQTAAGVNIYQLFAMETIDEEMKEMLNRKQNIFDQIIDGKAAAKDEEDLMKKIDTKIMEKYLPLTNRKH